MTILQAQQRLHEKWMELTKDGKDEEMMQALSIADTVLGNYDESLKNDMVAMLTELQLEIEELEKPRCHNASHADGCVSKWKVEGVIQQKINSLKENENGNK